MKLHTLLRQVDPSLVKDGIPDVEITALTEDSRRVSASSLFFAKPGTKTDGSKFMADAAAKGAVAAVAAAPIKDSPLPLIIVPTTASNGVGHAASRLAHAFYGHPTRHLKLLGVTGTNGKTTTTYLIRHVLKKFHIPCGMIGTVETDDGQSAIESEMTTPSAIDVAALLGRMVANGCKAAAMEVSSHALHQGRVAGATFAGAAFTNLTGDHLDYHGTMDAYAAAKAILFHSLPKSAAAAMNGDSEWTPIMLRGVSAKSPTWGFGPKCQYRATDLAVCADGSSFILHAPAGKIPFKLQLIGRHNIENALAALILCHESFNLPLDGLATAIADAPGAPGRLQTVRAGQPFAVLVDYAHTDDALENVLTALRPLTRGRLRVVFGCGGDRDKTKRPRMARVAQRLADDIYITSDNPRTEDPLAILADIQAGLSPTAPEGLGKSVNIEPDRKKAIEKSLTDARIGDVLLIAGKGHENYQILGTTKHHFDDVEEATQVLGRRL